jgi:site-specific recombinase XerC
MRSQTQVNRVLGLNAGKERRSTAANRDEISEARREQVFRQDVKHTGNAGDPTLAEKMARAAQSTLRILQLRAAAPGMTTAELGRALGFSQQYVCYLLKEIERGERDPETGMKYRKRRHK